MQYRDDSLYRNTPITKGKYLDILEPTIVDKENYSVRPLIIEPKYNHRPDVLAYDLYGNSKLWWVFALFNQDKLADPIMDFKSGLSITGPIRFA